MRRASREVLPILVAALVVTIAVQATPRTAQAQTSKSVELPRTITFVVPFGPGGGVDVQTRVVARYLPKYLPGSPTMIVENVVGAGGRAGMQRVVKSKPDASVIGATYTPDALGTQAIFGAEAGYDFSKFVLLTSTYHSPYTLAVGPKTPYKSLADLKNAGKPISFCTTGGIDMAYSVIGAKAIGFPFRLVPGYKGAPDGTAAMIRGDCEAVSFGIELVNRYIGEGVRPIALYAAERNKLWPTVPTAKEQGSPLELQINVVYLLPPGASSELADLLRNALANLYQNKEFLDAVRATKYTPTFGDTKQTQQIAAGLMELYSKYARDLREAAQQIR
jgi:tripartite-type tricarboxylate transporter receptor subunit TctC